MAIKRRQNWLGQQRVDAPHLKSIESAVSNDFDELLSGLVTGEGKSYVVRGFKINMPGSIGSSANGLQMIVEDSSFLHGGSDESGTFYTIPTGTPTEILSSTTNDKVEGSFTPNTDNYIGIEFIREVDDITTDQVYFWNPTTNVELTKTVPLALILGYKIVITTSNFSSNVLPISIVQTDSSNNVISITDRRPLLFRLGTAGFDSPDPFYTYPWDDGREENFYTSTSSTSDPFSGGDKQIPDMKTFFDVLMSSFKALKGTPYWYSESSGGSIYRLRQDTANTAFTGKGNISHGIAWFTGKVSGMTSDVTLKAISTAVTLTADGVKDIDTLISEHNIANNDEPVYLMDGDGSQVPTADITMTSVAGQVNWSSDVFLNFIGGRLRYKIKENETSGHVTLADNQVAYLNLVRGEDIIPNLVFTNSGFTVASVGSVNWTEDLEAGDFIKNAAGGDENYYEIASVDSLFQVTLTEAFQEISSGPNGYDAQYAFGVYETSAAPSTPRHVFVADRGAVPFSEDYFWLLYRQDDIGSVAKVYARVLGGQELEQGEERNISDNTSQSILNYIGAANESDNDPDYTNATGSAIANIHLTDGENLTRGIKRLEHRDDIIPRVRVIDLVSTALPTGTGVVIDGETLNDDDYVFFVNSAIEGLYRVSNAATAIAFEKMPMFKGSDTTINGDLIRVSSGTDYLRTIWKRTVGVWTPIDVANAVKEPTGFPNRVDSELSFDNGTRTFSVGPKAPQTFFDVFAKGNIFRFESTQSITIPDAEGIYFFYFETNGVLAYSTVFDPTIITDKIFISTIYWDETNKKQILLGDERHGMTMDAATHSYLHALNGTVITEGGAINFTPYVDAVAAQFIGQVAGMTGDVTIDADVDGTAGNVTLTPVSAIAATATLTLTTDIILTSVALGAARNTETFTTEVLTAATNPTNTVLVDFTGTAAAIVCTVTPNDGTNNGAVTVDLTTAELVELINTGDVAAKTGQITITDGSGLRTLQTATGGDATLMVDAGEGDSVLGTYASGADALNVTALIAAHNIAFPANTLTLSAGNGSQVPTADIVLTGGQDGSGAVDADAQIALNGMTIRDEDIVMNIVDSPAPADIFEQILSPIAEVPVYYRDGALGVWRRDDATQYPVKQGTSRIQWNDPVSNWAQTDVQEGYFVSMWVYATNHQDEPVITILGQKEHAILSDAQEQDSPETLSVGTMITQEFKLLYRCIYQSSSSMTNTPKAALVDVRDLRATEDTAFAQVSPNDHGSLSGLGDPDHPASAINTLGVEKDGGLSQSDTGVGEALTTLNRLLGQLRLKEHPTNKKRVVVTGANRILNSGTTIIQEIKNLVIKFDGAQIDFTTGQIFEADGITSLGIDFTPEVITPGEYFAYSVTLIPGQVNADNTISAQLIVLPAAGSNAVKIDVPKAPFAQGTKLGQVIVREDTGSIEDITEGDIFQLGTGGGGSGGSGDANELLERLKNRLANYGAYEYMTPVIFSSVEEDETDPSTTAEYSVVNSNYDFPLTGNQFVSIQMLDDEFLAEEIGLNEIELIHYWNAEALDENATYEVSRNGGAEYQAVSMERIGQSETYRGIHQFADEVVDSFTQTVGGTITGPEDFTDVNELSRVISIPSPTMVKKVTAEITKTGAAVGYVYAVAVRDDGGSPSTDPLDIIGQSSYIDITNDLVAGSQSVDFDVAFTVPANDYHIIFKTEVMYKTDYTNSAGARKISIGEDGTGIVYTASGSILDLRVRITSSVDEVVSEGFGIFYKDDAKIVPIDGLINRYVKSFVGNVENLHEFTPTYTVDPVLTTIYHWEEGKAYRYGVSWVLNAAGNVEFPPNTFNVASQVSLEFLQIQGGSFDNSDTNKLLMAINHLGSTNPLLDLSAPGRGIHLRSYDGTLYEIVIKDGGVGLDIYEVN